MNNSPRKIVFTGGGSAGHVTPNLALIAKCQEQNWQVFYIGSLHGLEKEIISKIDIPYFSIPSAGLIRSFTWKNLLMPFKVITGILKALWLLHVIKPQVVFSKGGFVALPIVFAAWILRIPTLAHESDISPGLTNKLSFPFIRKLCITFNVTSKFFTPRQQKKILYTGTPMRPELFSGDAQKGVEFCGFNSDKPVLMVQGGGLGARNINLLIRELLPTLLKDWQIAHFCGKGKVDTNINLPGYKQFAYLHSEFNDVLACADLVISRAGANSVYELLALHKLAILLPLAHASRGDQIQNAQYCNDLKVSKVLLEKDLSAENLLFTISKIQAERQEFKQRLINLELPDATEMIYTLITVTD